MSGKQNRAKRNMARWNAWAQDNDSIMQISYPRSGRDWLRHKLIRNFTGRVAADPEVIDDSDYEKYIYFVHHGAPHFSQKEYVGFPPRTRYILLVRDPRDAVLSSTYRWAITHPEQVKFGAEALEVQVEHVCREWGKRIVRYLCFKPLLIQYECMCLNPEKVIWGILDFLGVTETLCSFDEVLDEVDVTKTTILHSSGRVEEKYSPKRYKDGLERYQDHCLKWQRDSYFTSDLNDQVFEALEETMLLYGYTREGHDIVGWSCLES